MMRGTATSQILRLGSPSEAACIAPSMAHISSSLCWRDWSATTPAGTMQPERNIAMSECCSRLSCKSCVLSGGASAQERSKATVRPISDVSAYLCERGVKACGFSVRPLRGYPAAERHERVTSSAMRLRPLRISFHGCGRLPTGGTERQTNRFGSKPLVS